jgi:hypothetical protein
METITSKEGKTKNPPSYNRHIKIAALANNARSLIASLISKTGARESMV